ncbi:hypothetical protein [Cytobacillus gottheilii]|uniref:hypothetical protein n=1 Tax=Cytobacillus gottheilii TaxID=859144 RepID=UPI0009B9CBC9|nr:hypothetical protein [Cytobacillus gottheilii]
MNIHRGEIILHKFDYEDGGHSINYSFDGNKDFNWKTKAFRIFKNQCVGHPNMTIFKCKTVRDERYEKAKQILITAGYEAIEGWENYLSRFK